VLGISSITNMAAGVLDQPINHEEVLAVGNSVSTSFRQLVEAVIDRLPEAETVEM
jgi:purine-nucleoside phosphorylase